MKQIYIGEVDSLGYLDVDIWDCKKAELKRLYLSPERLYELVDALREAGEEIQFFRKESCL